MSKRDDSRSDDEESTQPKIERKRDVALVHGVTPDGEGLRVVRSRSNRLEFGAVRRLKEGAPILGEVVKLTPRPEFPLLCDVEVQVAAPEPSKDVASVAVAPSTQSESSAGRRGPVQVATDDYRRNWDLIWSRQQPKKQLAN